LTKSGTRCQAPPLQDHAVCYHHAEHLEAERLESRRRGALSLHYGGQRGEPVLIRTTDDVLKLLEQAATDAMGKKPSVMRARVLTAIATASLRAVESHDLEARVQTLEARLQPRIAK